MGKVHYTNLRGGGKTHAIEVDIAAKREPRMSEAHIKALLDIPVRHGRRATLLNTSGVRGIVTNLHRGF